MARMDLLGRTLACRLMLLLFWTAVVCFVLYTSSERNAADFSSKRSSASLPPVQLRSPTGGPPAPAGRRCQQKAWTPQLVEALRRVTTAPRPRGSGRPGVHCSVLDLCRPGRAVRADCFSPDCRTFRVRLADRDHVIPAVSAQALSDIVTSSLRENSFMTVDDLNRYVDVECQAPVVASFALTGDIVSGPDCERQPSAMTVEKEEGKEGETTLPKTSIHIVYFRFLSQWELPVRFPGLLSLLERASGSGARVGSLGRHQASAWGDEETLSLLLQGRAGPFQARGSLLDTLRRAGYCVRMEDLSCSRSRGQEALVQQVTTSRAAQCPGLPPPRPRHALVERLCTEGNLTEAGARAGLTSLLVGTHGALGGAGGRGGPLFSLTVLNAKDFSRQPAVLDSVLRNLLLALLGEAGDRLVMVLGGVGNPTFLRFDQSVRLQPQASNPAALLLATGNASLGVLARARKVGRSLFSLGHVHTLLKDAVSAQGGAPPPDQSALRGLRNITEDGRSDSCEALQVKPPFLCLCEEQFVSYENDTLMAGFADFAVGLINAKLQQSPDAQAAGKGLDQCATLHGVSFSNVRVGQHQDRRRILMDLTLEDELTRTRMFRRTVLDLWDTDKVPQAQVRFYDHRAPLDDLDPLTGRLLKALCKTGETLAPRASSEAGLVKQWGQERHLGLKGSALHVHDNCLFLVVRDFGDSVGVEAANVCTDRFYDVMLHLSLMNMVSLTALPLSVRLGHAQRGYVTTIVKVSYTVPTFAYKLHPDFEVTYAD